MSNTLYVIGNGFDCMYNLSTTVKDFRECLSECRVYNETGGALEVFETYGVDFWNEFEGGLADVDIEEIAMEKIEQPNYLSDRESDRDGGILNMQMYTKSLKDSVTTAFDMMVDNAEDELDDRSCITKELFEDGDQIITFNYTSTIERLYELPPQVGVFHIHGDSDSEKIFGYRTANNALIKNNEGEEGDFYIREQEEELNSFYQDLKKDFQYDGLEDFLEKYCNEIDKVVVIGHSMSEVDSEYMELIERKINPESWEISQYENSPSVNELKNYSFANKIHTFQSSELLQK